MNNFPQWSFSMIRDCADAIVAQALDGIIVGCNPAAEKLFGFSAQELIGRPAASLLHDSDQVHEADVMRHISQGAAVSLLPFTGVHRDGTRLALSITLSPIRNENGEIIGASRVVRSSEQALQETQKLLNMSYRDPLTGLANRSRLLDRLEQAMNRDERSRQHGAVLFLDLDRFKSVNDTAGHHAGDRILIRAARRLEIRLRRCDTIARWGGDEFVILLEDLGEDFNSAVKKAGAVAEKIVDALSHPYQFDHRTHLCPPSVGVALFRGITQPTIKLIDTADRAMYRAKAAAQGSKTGHYFVDLSPPEDGGAERNDTAAA